MRKPADVSGNEDVARLFTLLQPEPGAPEVLVRIAGEGVFNTTAGLAVLDLQRANDGNLTEVYRCRPEASPRLRNRENADIVHLYKTHGRNLIFSARCLQRLGSGVHGSVEVFVLTGEE
jgi:hypothetical protein